MSRSLFAALVALQLVVPFSGAAFALDFELKSLHIDHPFTRATPPGAQVAGAFMTIENRGKDADRLVSATSPVAGQVGIHEMAVDGGVMKMRMLDTIALSANKPYILAPGGFHLMLFDLKKPLNIGDEVSFVLHFKPTSENAKDKKDTSEITQNIKAKVQAAPQAPTDEHDMKTMAK